MIRVFQSAAEDAGFAERPIAEITRAALENPERVTWIDLADPTLEEERKVLEELGGFHALAIEDCRSPAHHPKVDEFPGYLFVIMHGILPVKAGEDFDTVLMCAFLGDRYLVTYHRDAIASIDRTLEHCRANPPAFLRGPDNIFHLVVDDMVDAYLPVLEQMDDALDTIEDEVFLRPSNRTLHRILRMKKDVMRMRRISTHQREVLNRLSRGEFSLVTEEERIYYRDVYDHLVRIADLADTYRDLISGTLDAYLSVVSNRLNEVMKTLTIIATIMLPLSLIAGIYGMNFKFLPELEWPYGYFFALGLMAVIALGMLLYFRRKGWFAKGEKEGSGEASR